MAVLAKFLAATPGYLALRRSQYWDAEQFRDYTEARLEKVLAAAANIPFYRERFEGSRIGDFAGLPILSRERMCETLTPQSGPCIRRVRAFSPIPLRVQPGCQ